MLFLIGLILCSSCFLIYNVIVLIHAYVYMPAFIANYSLFYIVISNYFVSDLVPMLHVIFYFWLLSPALLGDWS